MAKKTFAFITGVVGGVAAIAEAAVAYFQPAYSTAIVAAIPIAVAAVSDILILFVKSEE